MLKLIDIPIKLYIGSFKMLIERFHKLPCFWQGKRKINSNDVVANCYKIKYYCKKLFSTGNGEDNKLMSYWQ